MRQTCFSGCNMCSENSTFTLMWLILDHSSLRTYIHTHTHSDSHRKKKIIQTIQNYPSFIYHLCKLMITTCSCRNPWGEGWSVVPEYSKADLSWCFVLCGNFETCFQHKKKKKKIAFKNLHLKKPFNQQWSWSNVYIDLSTFTLCILLAVPRSLEPSR